MRARDWQVNGTGVPGAAAAILDRELARCYQEAMAKLVLSLPGSTPIAHELIEELVTIGRAPDNLIQVDDPSVSGRHAQINCVADVFQLQDLNSTNGTRVNDRTITSVTALRAGDRLRFGKVEARFECETPSHAQPLPTLTAVEAKPAAVSTRPTDFANASPFSRRKSPRDLVQTAIFAIVAVAILAFLGSMIALMQMQPPAP